ncbi:MAG: hypothetical protein K0Q76_3413 [Panacagrimonas sp.]|nr:hypothetical protein [Panacagrimonas sp.]MCC2658305.1 hypothetical protein [Panacagrimonas sp.]
MTIHLSQSDVRDGTGVRREVLIENRSERIKLFYKVDNAALSDSMNSAVIASVFKAMSEKKDVVVHGAVSKTLLENIDDFQDAWSSWMPQYSRVTFSAEKELTDPSTGDRRSILAFSGGVDATFSLWRHTRSLSRHKTNMHSALLVHGFDLPLNGVDVFKTARDSAEKIANDAGVALKTIETNVRSTGLAERWPYTYIPALASCLHLFDAAHDVGIIGSDEPYSALVIPWGSNPITNHLLSSGRFQVKYDSGGYTRTQKVRVLSEWPTAMENLRVCWEGPKTGKNCGRCEKCIRTILNFRAIGVEKPACFEADVTNEMIRSVRLTNKIQRSFMLDIISEARKSGVSGDWLETLKGLVGS